VVATSRVFFFRFASRDFFPIGARGTRRRSRVDGFPGARGWMVGLFHQPNQNRVESSCHPHHPSRSWNLDRFDSRRSTGRRRERPSRAEIDWKVTIAIAPGLDRSVSRRHCVRRPTFSKPIAPEPRGEKALSSDERNETKQFHGRKAMRARARKLEYTKLTTAVLLP